MNPLTQEQKDIILDLLQFTLDLAGVLDPTPISDASSALLSLSRGDWKGMGIGTISMLPYLGDLTKLSRLPRYRNSIVRAVELARKDEQFSKHIRKHLVAIKALLDDVPAEHLPPLLHKLRRDLNAFVGETAPMDLHVRPIYEKLDRRFQKDFLRCMGQAPIHGSSKRLRKYWEPVKEDDLLAELQSKGFIQAKKGKHPLHRLPEDSDIYIRKILDDDGTQCFEAVRIDRKAAFDEYMPQAAYIRGREQSVEKGVIQTNEKLPRREHHTLSETSERASSKRGGGLQTDMGRMQEELARGVRKGNFSHWHHEKFPSTPENLKIYIQKEYVLNAKGDTVVKLVPGLKRLDPAGEVILRSERIPAPVR